MPNSINQAQPPLEFIAPAFNPLVLRGCQMVLPWWLRFKTTIRDIQAENVEMLVELYRQFQEGKIRFLIAFRHPHTEDRIGLIHLLWRMLPQIARKQGVSLQDPIWVHIIYDRGIPLWAGESWGWVYSQLGGTPIHRGKVDRLELKSVRHLFANGLFPMAGAPEGATNGLTEIVSPLEPGIAHMGFWCVEDLVKAGRSEQVLIVPLGIKYSYVEPPWDALSKLLSELEADCGLGVEEKFVGLQVSIPDGMGDRAANLYRRVIRVGDRVLTVMEEFYSRYYNQTIPTAPAILTATDANAALEGRLKALLDVALKVAEEYFNLAPKGNAIDRCRRLEQAGWDRIYREDVKSLEALSPLERGLADRIAEEASMKMWHMRMVESFAGVTGNYIREKPTAERFAEIALLMWDVMSRIKAGNPLTGRPSLGVQRVKMTVGQPISVSERYVAYQGSRRQAVADLTQDLQAALEAMI